MNLSLNETAAMAKKAARGAGYSWGMSEEAARAVRWLTEFGLDGSAALLALIEHVDGVPETCRPGVFGPVWNADSGVVCPLAAGTAIADNAFALREMGPRIANVRSPILLLPFAADAALVTGQPVGMKVDTSAMVTDGTGLSGVPFAGNGDVEVQLGASMGVSLTNATRAAPDPAVWAGLSAFAARTYAPATEASRALGAGAGTTDND